MELFKDTHLVKLELLSNATTTDSALNYIRNKQQQQKRLSLNSTGNGDKNNKSNDGQLSTTGGRLCFVILFSIKGCFRFLFYDDPYVDYFLYKVDHLYHMIINTSLYKS
jgi:hypothetical protein